LYRKLAGTFCAGFPGEAHPQAEAKDRFSLPNDVRRDCHDIRKVKRQ
jgi:hypothetical protein